MRVYYCSFTARKGRKRIELLFRVQTDSQHAAVDMIVERLGPGEFDSLTCPNFLFIMETTRTGITVH